MNKKYQIDTAENREFQKSIRDDLLSFGHKFPAADGSSYWLGTDGYPCTEKNRETWITSRMAHVYTIGCLLGHEGSFELTQKAITGLSGVLHDASHGGWFAGIHADGTPYGDKQCYAHAFVILASTSAGLIGVPEAEALHKDALEVFDRYFLQDELGLSTDTWNQDFSKLDTYRGINANMHTVEAFLAAADASGDEKYRARAGRIIEHVIGWAKNNEWRIPEHYTEDWQPALEVNKDKPDDQFKPYGATPGHGIEWARLTVQWALSTYKDDAEKAAPFIAAAEEMYNRAIADGWNSDGAPGIVYTTDWTGTPVVHDRMHWTLAEAINTSAVLYHVTGKEKYAAEYAEFMQYLDEKVIDHVNGSWFHQLDRNNEVLGTVWPGKCDLYHALQSTLIPYCRPDISVASAVKEKAFLE